MNGRERILSHLEGSPVDHLPLMPITMQFAADQIGANYHKYATDFRVLAEGQLKVAEIFDFDYVNTMSDPAREAADCGAEIEYFEDQPPALMEDRALLTDKTALATLQIPDPLGGGRMFNGIQAVSLLKEHTRGDKLVEGWIEGPCAEAADLRGINTMMLDFFDDPAFVHDLFAFVVEMELCFAKAQLAAGADLIGIGDAAASLVGPEIYREFVWPWEKKLVDGLHAMGARTRLHICGDTRFCLTRMGQLGCAVVDLDFLAPVDMARSAMGPRQVLLGNLNPVAALRDSTPTRIQEALALCHRQAGSRFIVGAGCEVPRDVPVENLRAVCEFALSTSA